MKLPENGGEATRSLQIRQGIDAANLIWNDSSDAQLIVDPRTPEFAQGMVDTCVGALKGSPGLIKKMMQQAAAGAEDLAVSQFQGIIEVIQNADDVRATEVRFALRYVGGQRQLLIVHNGQPVTCHNVLGMALPYLTTKTARTDQRGRFGIGMKTLKRIADSIAVHSAPYHFSGDLKHFERIPPEQAIPGFYAPDIDTMLVVDLKDSFEENELAQWYESWSDDSLLFLASVSSFRWCEIDGKTRDERTLSFSSWTDADYRLEHPAIHSLQIRRVEGRDNNWKVWRATIEVPTHLHPAHKARTERTDISIALADEADSTSLFIGFRTNVPSNLSFSLDAQFDPSTSRESIIENPWNNWLIERTCEVCAEIAAGLFLSDPKKAWLMVPLKNEHIDEANSWLQRRFATAFQTVREWLGQKANVALHALNVELNQIVYEDETLSGLLHEADLERIAAELNALPTSVRDEEGRWRDVISALDVSTCIGTDELLQALDDGLFCNNDAQWWVEAGARLVDHHPDADLLGRTFLISDCDAFLTCTAKDKSDNPLVFEAEPSAFAKRWKLLEHLNPIYGESESGKKVISWLAEHAAFTTNLNATVELEAFAENFADNPIEITDDELRELRDCFDQIPDSSAEQLGAKVGAVLMLDGFAYSTERQPKKVLITEGYLCKTLDGENSTWPDAAAKTPEIYWIAARYETVLKTDIVRGAKRKRKDGSVSRGARRLLMILGAETAPRLIETTNSGLWGNNQRLIELRQLGANQVGYDLVSPDLSRVLSDMQAVTKRDAKARSSALVRTLSRNWERLYSDLTLVPAHSLARKYTYFKGQITAAWLIELRTTPWIAVGRGDLVEPSQAVLRNPETETIYSKFACDLVGKDLDERFATSIGLIMDVRIGDLLNHLEELRGNQDLADTKQITQIYRAISKRCPKDTSYNTAIGELKAQDIRKRFQDGQGLIFVGDNRWRRPDKVMRGLDIFHGKREFVPGGDACTNLWVMLEVPEPKLDDCISFCRDLAAEPYTSSSEASLMDVYRYMAALTKATERKHREKLRGLPLYCNGGWSVSRPVFYIENTELRDQLFVHHPSFLAWRPPCDPRDLKSLMDLLSIETLVSELKVESGEDVAVELGEQFRSRFEHAIDHLSAELARSEPTLREKISIDWDKLKCLPLLIYDNAIPVRAMGHGLPGKGCLVSLNALRIESPDRLYFRLDTIGEREFGGRLIASFFPRADRRRIDLEWTLAWQKSLNSIAGEIRLASDARRTEAMQETMSSINSGSKGKVDVTPPKSRNASIKPRTLKETVGAMSSASLTPGSAQFKAPSSSNTKAGGLRSIAPDPSKPSNESPPSAPTAYNNADLEQRGWEILTHALHLANDQQLVDFRNRQGVGADGVIDWKLFVEMKATGRNPQTQVELSNNEFERAKQRGSDFILALVSGLETGYKDEVRLIFDPVNCTTVRPTNGVRLVGLHDAPTLIIPFEDAGDS